MVILQLWMDIKVRPFRGNNPLRCRGKGTFSLSSYLNFWLSVRLNKLGRLSVHLKFFFSKVHIKKKRSETYVTGVWWRNVGFLEDSTCRRIIAILEVFGKTKFALELSLFARSVLHIARISNFERVVSWEIVIGPENWRRHHNQSHARFISTVTIVFPRLKHFCFAYV